MSVEEFEAAFSEYEAASPDTHDTLARAELFLRAVTLSRRVPICDSEGCGSIAEWTSRGYRCDRHKGRR